jgi:4-hydroxyproline epimerase
VVKFWDGPINADRIENLLTITRAIRTTLNSNGITGTNGAPLDHVQLLSEPERELGDLRNFVLCPGGSYDRSPCGTGTSAALACFAADGLLLPGKHLRMESVIGSVFEASYQRDGDAIIPTIGGEAYVTGKSELMLNPRDPYCYGISPR